jgi:hypothetical protein
MTRGLTQHFGLCIYSFHDLAFFPQSSFYLFIHL